MKHDINVIFFLFKSKINSKGLSPIYCRVTRNYERKHFSTGFRIKPDEWDSITSTVFKNALSPQINAYLIAIKARAIELALRYKLSDKDFTLNQFVDQLLQRDGKEIVSELLGHSSMKITQKHYGKVVNKKLGEQMDELGKKLK